MSSLKVDGEMCVVTVVVSKEALHQEWTRYCGS